MNNTIFSSAFEAQTLTAAINQVPASPNLLQALFEEDGITTTELVVERREDALSLVPASPRGAPAKNYGMSRRDALTFRCAHLSQRATVLADSLQDVRQFGSDALYTVEQRRNEMLTVMRADIDYTLERHRLGALAGQILDADGSVLLDLLAEFGVVQQTHDMGADIATTKLRTKFVEARRKAEAALGNLRPRRWVCVSSPSFFDAVCDHDSSAEFLAASPLMARELRDDMRAGFNIGGVDVVEFNFETNAVPWIAAGEAYLVPVGAPGLLLGRFAPADTVEAINRVGLPYHVSPHELPHGKGVSLEAQSNPVYLCTRPRAIVKLTA